MLTYRVLSHIPDFVPLGGMVLGGVWWITHRREEVALPRQKPRNKDAGNRTEEAMMARDVKFKLTFWKVRLPVPDGRRASTRPTSASRRPGRIDQSERSISLGHLDRLRRALRRNAGCRRIHARRGRPHFQHQALALRSCGQRSSLRSSATSWFRIALMFDLGKPYSIWHPLIMWNPHSVMFEIAYCVMLYTTVLLLEFSPIVLERFQPGDAVEDGARDPDSAGDRRRHSFHPAPVFAGHAVPDRARKALSLLVYPAAAGVLLSLGNCRRTGHDDLRVVA